MVNTMVFLFIGWELLRVTSEMRSRNFAYDLHKLDLHLTWSQVESIPARNYNAINLANTLNDVQCNYDQINS